MNQVVGNESRLNKSIANVATGGILQFLTLLLNFVVRIVFVRVIGYSYLGISSLFTNILTVLSVADLGFGTSISISLYSALKKADEKHIAGIISYYKKVYFTIGIIVFMIGMVLMPYVGHIVNTETPIPNLQFYFFIYLVNLVSTYFISYRHAIIKADQKNGTINVVQSLVLLVKSLIELIVIVVLPHFMELQHVYITYLIVMVLSTYASEIWCSILAKKMYPYAFKGASIPKEEKKEISKNVKSLLLYKVCNAVNKSIDSILISILVSTTILGKYSNYTLIIGVLMGFGCLISRNSIASLGNYVLSESKEKQANMFYLINFVHILIAAFFIVNYVGILEPFFHFAFGLDSTLSVLTLVLTAVHIGFDLNYQVNELFRETTKMFRKIPYISVINLVLNIILSIILGHFFGLEGIIAGTLIAYFLTSFWFETFALFKYHLQMSSLKVWLKLAYAVLVIGLFATGSFLITHYVKIDELLYKLAFSIGVSLVSSILCILSFFWFKEFKRVVEIAKTALSSVIKMIHKIFTNTKIQIGILILAMVGLTALVVYRDLYAHEVDKIAFVILVFISACLLNKEFFISYVFFLIPFHSGLPTGYIYIILAGLFILKNIHIFIKKWWLIFVYLFIPTFVFVYELVISKKYGQMTPVTDALQVFSVLLFAAFLLYDKKSISKKPLLAFAFGSMIVGLIVFAHWYKITSYMADHSTKTFKELITMCRFGDVDAFINGNEKWWCQIEYPYKVSMQLTENPNYFGFIMLMGIMCASYVIVKERSIWLKLLCIQVFIICFPLGLFTVSKSFFICLAIFVVFFLFSLAAEKRINVVLAFLIIGMIGFISMATIDKVEYLDKMIFGRLDDDSHRFKLIRDYFDFVISDKDIMLFGVGGSRVFDLAMIGEPPHNAFSQISCSYGFIGFGVLFIAMIVSIWKGKIIQKPCLVALTPCLVFIIFSMTSQIFFPPNTLLYGLPVFYILAINRNEICENKLKQKAINGSL